MARGLKPDATPADRLGAMLPAEVTGLYVSVRAFFEAPGTPNPFIYIGIFAFISLLTALLYIYIVRGVTNWIHLAVYAALFLSWVCALDVKALQDLVPTIPMAAILGAASFILSFLVPIIIPSPTIASEKATGS